MSRQPGKVSTFLVAAVVRLLGKRGEKREQRERARERERQRELERRKGMSQDELDKLREEEQKGRPGVPPPARERDVGASGAVFGGVLLALLLATVAAAGFIVFYVAFPDTQLLGLCIGLALLFLGVASALAGKRLFPREEAVEERHDFGDEEKRAEIEGILEESVEGVSRRRVLTLAAGAAGATIGAAALMPVTSLGPSVGARIRQTQWSRGRRVVDEAGRPFRPEDVPIGAFRTGFPEGGKFDELDAPLILVRLPWDEIQVSDEFKRFMPDGVMAYSKICPHAGCAVSIYRHPLYEPTEPRPALVCPCHFSTFDVSRGGHLVFGPAGRDLPSLPLALNAAGELIAASGFTERVGPSYGGVRKGPDDQPLHRGEG
ncbi:MAG TPA: Rieske 2Fe-2S domain-containing protein [Solirubrobacteraceae bacterium]|nr:Rieske 2Fe-2S domain-containing protein [Solirubrobacteraceae bacterium]